MTNKFSMLVIATLLTACASGSQEPAQTTSTPTALILSQTAIRPRATIPVSKRNEIEEKVRFGESLSGADLRNAELYFAELANVDLSGADLTGAHLNGANLSNAKMIGTNLTKADLTGANLISADLTNANLTGANLQGADLRWAKWDWRTIWPSTPTVAPKTPILTPKTIKPTSIRPIATKGPSNVIRKFDFADFTGPCKRDEASVKSSSVNVRVGPGAGRTGEVVYSIQSYLKAGECVTPTQRTQDGGWVRIGSAPRPEADGGWVAVELLSFGSEVRNVPRITIAPTLTAERQNAGLNLPVGIEHLGGANHVCYNIQGNNADELNRQMDEHGPPSDGDYEYLAMANYRYEPSGGTCYADGNADLSDFIISTEYSITMPCWRPSSGTNSDLIASFDNSLMRNIAVHELRHVEIAREYASILQQRFRASNTCDLETTKAIWDQVSVEVESAQDAFHASPEGQPIDWP